MSNTETAWENVSQDFSWLSSLLPWLADIAPTLAVVWAIYAFFRQRKEDRDDELRRERQKIYREYLSALDAVGDDASFATLQEEAFAKSQAVMMHHQIISLIAPDSVAKASLEFINTLFGTSYFGVDGKPIKHISKLRVPISKQVFEDITNATEPSREARHKLVVVMRQDIVAGTKIDPSLTRVEDLN